MGRNVQTTNKYEKRCSSRVGMGKCRSKQQKYFKGQWGSCAAEPYTMLMSVRAVLPLCTVGWQLLTSEDANVLQSSNVSNLENFQGTNTKLPRRLQGMLSPGFDSQHVKNNMSSSFFFFNLPLFIILKSGNGLTIRRLLMECYVKLDLQNAKSIEQRTKHHLLFRQDYSYFNRWFYTCKKINHGEPLETQWIAHFSIWVVFHFVSWDRISACNSSWPKTMKTKLASDSERDPPASASPMLGSKASATTPSSVLVFLSFPW